MIKKFLKWLLVLLSLFIFGCYVSGNGWVIKALRYNFVNIDDYKIFENRIIKAGNPKEWNNGWNYNKTPITPSLEKLLTDNESVAYLVIKNDSVRIEKYWDGYSAKSLSSSFSMAKSFVGAMIGIALKEGKIKSLDEPVANYIPEFKECNKHNITIKHLLMMSSGLDWDEGYASLFSPVTESYYGKDLYKQITSLKFKEPSGKYWEYKSCDTQLLGFVLEKATGKTLSDYCSEKIWTPLNAVHIALWSLDKKNGHEKAYSAYNSNARDFARLAKLYMQLGNWNGVQIIDTAYVLASITPNTLIDRGTQQPNNIYGYQWWQTQIDSHNIFYMRGILGQYVIAVPDMNMIIVRLGKKRSTGEDGIPNDYPVIIRESIKMFS
ncbi:MAG TPA: serine hydrolase [Bacteroidia bacterium]|nr:serine hydrolase [Bacteroidia bacterium]HNU33440.1 serine hydrolase [Bacteroidia bacterium]